MQVVGVGALDLRRDEFADAQRATGGDKNLAVDFRRVNGGGKMCQMAA